MLLIKQQGGVVNGLVRARVDTGWAQPRRSAGRPIDGTAGSRSSRRRDHARASLLGRLCLRPVGAPAPPWPISSKCRSIDRLYELFGHWSACHITNMCSMRLSRRRWAFDRSAAPSAPEWPGVVPSCIARAKGCGHSHSRPTSVGRGVEYPAYASIQRESREIECSSLGGGSPEPLQGAGAIGADPRRDSEEGGIAFQGSATSASAFRAAAASA